VRSFFYDIEMGRRRGFVTSVNLAEFYYKTCEKIGEEAARTRYYQCRDLLEIMETDRDLTLSAGKEKCRRRGNLSLADCFAIAASNIKRGTLLTTNPELAEIKDVDVKFIEVQ